MRKQSLEIDRILIVSLLHLTLEDRQALINEETDLIVYEMGEYGWMILARNVDLVAPYEHSDNLEKLLEFARENDCDWIRFDTDANEIAGFETFE